jgi:uncharacterized protein GlcG (DUF336 family)
MTNTFRALFLAGAAIGWTRAAPAQGLVTQRVLSLDMARTIADATLAECRAKGFHTSVAVVDRAGQALVILRDEAATAHTSEMARRKAYTARTYRLPSGEFAKRTTPDSPLAGQRDFPDILALPGGVPILLGKEVIGAVASAGSNPESDDACARAGLAKVAELLK